MLRILLVNRFAWPDQSATAQLLTDLAEHWAASGHEVTVLAGQSGYTDAGKMAASAETHRGVHYLRTPASPKGRARMRHRLIDTARFFWSARKILRQPKLKPDVVVTLTDPPLIHAWTRLLLPSVRCIHWSMDVFPEIITAHSRHPLAIAADWPLRWVRNMSLRKQTHLVALHQDMAAYFTHLGFQSTVIPNWSPAELMESRDPGPATPAPATLRERWGLQGRIVVGYSGNLGRAHEAATVLAALPQIFAAHPEITFLFIGSGKRLQPFKEAALHWGAIRLKCLPYQDRQLLQATLAVPDIHWFSLLPQFSPFVFPSKLAGILSVGRPAIFVGKKPGEIAGILERNDCGLACASGDTQGFFDAVSTLANNPHMRARLSANALRYYEKTFSRTPALSAWDQLLGHGKNVAQQNADSPNKPK